MNRGQIEFYCFLNEKAGKFQNKIDFHIWKSLPYHKFCALSLFLSPFSTPLFSTYFSRQPCNFHFHSFMFFKLCLFSFFFFQVPHLTVFGQLNCYLDAVGHTLLCLLAFPLIPLDINSMKRNTRGVLEHFQKLGLHLEEFFVCSLFYQRSQVF